MKWEHYYPSVGVVQGFHEKIGAGMGGVHTCESSQSPLLWKLSLIKNIKIQLIPERHS